MAQLQLSSLVSHRFPALREQGPFYSHCPSGTSSKKYLQRENKWVLNNLFCLKNNSSMIENSIDAMYKKATENM